MQLVNIGFGNIVSADKIVAIVSPESAPIKRMVQEAKDNKTAVDATCGRRTRAVLIMDSGHIILSAVQPETVAGRLDKDLTPTVIPAQDEEKKIKWRKRKMIVKPSVTELLTKAKNRYELVIATSKRARQIAQGDEPLTKVKEKSVVTLAANEIAEGKVQIIRGENEEIEEKTENVEE